MSTLQVANVWLESSGGNRIGYHGDGRIHILSSSGTNVSGTLTATSINATSLYANTFPVATTVDTTFINSMERANIIASAATGNITYHLFNQSVMYLTSNATSNWNVNVSWSSARSLDSTLAVGESISFAVLTAQGATAFYPNNIVYIDNISQTPKWQGGTAPTAGNANSIDSYGYTIIKTGSATWTVLASQTQFK